MNTRFEPIKLLQNEEGYRVTQDSVLLANFIDCNFDRPLIDLGTGSGIILLLLSERCKGRKLYGIELNKNLYDIACKNISLNNIGDKVEIVHGDIRDVTKFFRPDTFEVVVTNPPYYEVHEGFTSSNLEKKMAKTQLSIDLSLIFKMAFYLLREKGNFYFIYPAKKLQTVFLLARRFQFTPKKIRFIHYNLEKNSELFLIKLGKRTKEGLIVEPPVIIEEKKDL